MLTAPRAALDNFIPPSADDPNQKPVKRIGPDGTLTERLTDKVSNAKRAIANTGRKLVDGGRHLLDAVSCPGLLAFGELGNARAGWQEAQAG